MGLIEMEKWYFDILTPNNDFVVLYFAYVRFACYFEGRFTIQIAPRDHQPVISRTMVIPILAQCTTAWNGSGLSTPFKQITMKESTTRVEMKTAQMTVDLDYGALTFIDFSKDRLIIDGKGTAEWQPLHLRSRVSGTIRLEGRAFKFDECDGYIDHVRSTIFPPRPPIKELYWGRIHHDRFDLTFAYATGRSGGKRWSRIFAAIGKEALVINGFTLTAENRCHSMPLDIEYPAACAIESRAGSVDVTIRIENLHNAIESRFIDQQELGKGTKYRFYKWVSRNPRGIKFIGQSRVHLAYRDDIVQVDNVLCVYEYVLFE